ncbi:uncharacterized protein LOC143300203 [Babylonia areolata]|uniref:uncharacterized protein LOC143300203 n=1 Tax=Babylonia areolata TaxID=304850 RepID=UPI003FD3DB02
MGKKKGGGGGSKRAFKKDPVATKLAGVAKKTKTKAVSTSLKRMNFQNRAQTEAVDAQFSQLQQQKKEKKAVQVPGAAKAEAEKVLLQAEAATKTRPEAEEVEEEPDVDMAAEEFAKLASAASS